MLQILRIEVRRATTEGDGDYPGAHNTAIARLDDADEADRLVVNADLRPVEPRLAMETDSEFADHLRRGPSVGPVRAQEFLGSVCSASVR